MMKTSKSLGLMLAAACVFMMLWGFNVINAAFFDNLNPFAKEPVFVAVETPPGEGMPEMTPRRASLGGDLLMKTAGVGIALAQLDLANDYYYGDREIAQDIPEAANWFRLAAEGEMPSAMTSLGHVIRDPIFKAKRRQKFVDWINGQALLGVPEAEFVMGRFHENGFLGFESNEDTALMWYKLAQADGYEPADVKVTAIDHTRDLAFYRKNIQMRPEVLQQLQDGAAAEADPNSDSVPSLIPGFSISPEVMKEIEGELQKVGKDSAKGQPSMAEVEAALKAAGTVPSNARNEAIQMLNLMPHKQVLALTDKGYAMALNRAGVNHFNGVNGAEQNIATARNLIWEAATAGEPDAFQNLSNMFANPGYSQPQKDAIMSWLSGESDKGNAYAQDVMGDFYRYGYYGVAEDKVRAVALEKSAAEQGVPSAQSDYGFALMLGNDVIKDQPEAFRWLTKAANQGHAGAQYWLGDAYENGKGTQQDHLQAVTWYERAFAQHYRGADLELLMLHATKNSPAHDDAKAARYAEHMVSETNSVVAHEYLGDFYYTGRHYARDSVKAAQHYQFASVGDYTGDAKFKLGEMYLAGDGVAQDKAKGIDLLKQAANDYSSEAKIKLKALGIEYDD